MSLHPRTYLWKCFLIAFVILGSVVVINWLVDPIGLYRYGTKGDWLRSRPMIADYLCMHKAHAVIPVKPDVLFLGSSRIHEGLDPHHLQQSAYNLGIWGSGPYEALRYLQHVAAAHLPATLILGIDVDYFGNGRGKVADFSEDRMLVKADGTPQTVWYADLAPSLLSTSALMCSMRTLLAQNGLPVTYDRGFGGEAELLLRHSDLASSVLTFNAAEERSPVLRFRAPDGSAPQLVYFQKLLDFCAERHIRLLVFIHPLHAVLQDIYTADWAMYSDWLHSVAFGLEATKGLTWECWDFSGYNRISTEPFPAASDLYSHMKYYSECSHYRGTVGNMVLDRMLGHGGPSYFGVRINAANLQADLDRLKSEKDAWQISKQIAPID